LRTRGNSTTAIVKAQWPFISMAPMIVPAPNRGCLLSRASLRLNARPPLKASSAPPQSFPQTHFPKICFPRLPSSLSQLRHGKFPHLEQRRPLVLRLWRRSDISSETLASAQPALEFDWGLDDPLQVSTFLEMELGRSHSAAKGYRLEPGSCCVSRKPNERWRYTG
jgi:hypothetical protein